MHNAIRLATLIGVLSATFSIAEGQDLRAMTKEFKKAGYTLYTPFRSDDLPGTLFLYARSGIFGGRVTEFTISKWDHTFTVSAESLHETDEHSHFDFSKTVSVEAQLDAGIVQPVVNGKLAARYASEFTVKWGGPLERRYIELARLAQIKDALSAGVRDALTFFKEQERLDDVYLVVDVVRAPSLEITFKAKPGFEAEFKAEKIKQFSAAGVTAKTEAVSDYTLKVKAPITVAYRALRLSDRFLTGVVAADDGDALLESMVGPYEISEQTE